MNTESAPFRTLLYYKYVAITDPEMFRDEHRELCKQLGLVGRILVGYEGLNGTVSGTPEATEAYKQALWDDARFADMRFKEHAEEHIPFRKLKVKFRPEIVTLGVKEISPADGGKHLTAQEWHALAEQEDVVILDARNNFESKIGKFRGAITPDINYFREFPKWVRENKDKLENKKVLMYCTGGIRCEPASALLKKEGIEEVYQLQDGIINYGFEIPDGLWEGSCFVFDERMKVQVNDDSHHELISTCHHCDAKTDVYYNCCNAECNKLILLCDECKTRSNNACSFECSQKHRAGVVKHWDIASRQAVVQE